MKHRVFISYAGAQKAHAETLCELLEANDVPCWIAPRDIPAGSDWVTGIPAAVEHAELVVALLSSEAQVSDWVDREIMWAVAKRRPLLPVVLGDTEPSERVDFLLGTIQRARVTGEQPEFGDLVAGVRELLGDETQASHAVSDAEPTEAPAPADPFTHRVTENRPAYFVLLVDHSSSMNRSIVGDRVSARDAVADVVNELLLRLLQESKRSKGYVHLFDVSVLSYGFRRDEEVESMLPGGAVRMSVLDLRGKWLRIDEGSREIPDESGGMQTVPTRRPVWVESRPGHGRTVMAAAFRRASELVEDWIAEHPHSVPPIVLNISDGRWTEEDPREAVRALQELATTLGPTLVFNCQLETKERDGAGRQLLYPSEIPKGFDPRTKELLLLSSVLPRSMREEARSRGEEIAEDARGLPLNARVTPLVNFLQISTRTVT
jgi:hypothetical protein